MAGFARGLMIALIVALTVWIFFSTGVLTDWFANAPLSLVTFLSVDFWMYLAIMIFIIGLIGFFVRNSIKWGGA